MSASSGAEQGLWAARRAATRWCRSAKFDCALQIDAKRCTRRGTGAADGTSEPRGNCPDAENALARRKTLQGRRTGRRTRRFRGRPNSRKRLGAPQNRCNSMPGDVGRSRPGSTVRRADRAFLRCARSRPGHPRRARTSVEKAQARRKTLQSDAGRWRPSVQGRVRVGRPAHNRGRAAKRCQVVHRRRWRRMLKRDSTCSRYWLLATVDGPLGQRCGAGGGVNRSTVFRWLRKDDFFRAPSIAAGGVALGR